MQHNGNWSRQICAYHDCLSWRERGYEESGIPIKIATCTFDGLTVVVIGQPMHNKSTQLAKHVSGDIAWSLRREHAGQTVLSSLLGNESKRFEADVRVLISNGSTKKLVRLVKHRYQWLVPEDIGTSSTKKKSTDDIQKDFTGAIV